MMKAQELAYEVAHEYCSLEDVRSCRKAHNENVWVHLSPPLHALTAFVWTALPVVNFNANADADADDNTSATAVVKEQPYDANDKAPTCVVEDDSVTANGQDNSKHRDDREAASATATGSGNVRGGGCAPSTTAAGICLFPCTAQDWREFSSNYRIAVAADSSSASSSSPTTASPWPLDRRSQARLDAFIAGISLAAPLGPISVSSSSAKSESASSHGSSLNRDASSSSSSSSSSLSTENARNGGGILKRLSSAAANLGMGADSSPSVGSSPRVAPPPASSSSSSLLAGVSRGEKQPARSGGGGSTTRSTVRYYPQIRERALATRLELYVRTLWRVRHALDNRQQEITAQQQRMLIPSPPPPPPPPLPPPPPPHAAMATAASQIPARSLKLRSQLLVDAFVDTVDNVHQQSTVLARLLRTATQEFLAVEHLSETILHRIRLLISDYIQSVSFASLAFLSSPESSAHQNLVPKVARFFRYLQLHFADLVADCELERMLQLSVDGELRKTLKTIEFTSIGHLLEVCQGFRSELSRIALAPDVRAPGFCDADVGAGGGAEGNRSREAIRQALRDLQREVITVNGHVLPPVSSRRDLVSLLSRTLNSRTLVSPSLTSAGRGSLALAASLSTRRRRKGVQQNQQHGGRSAVEGVSTSNFPTILPSASTDSNGATGDELVTTSDYDTDLSGHHPGPLGYEKGKGVGGGGEGMLNPGPRARRRNFRLSTIDFLTRRLLLAASRTGTFGDAYFVVRDLFGGEEVEVVPSRSVVSGHGGRSVRPGSIEITVRLASLTIRCHGSFDVYPKSLVGDCEPLIQLHTTTTETIGLQEVRAADCQGKNSEDRGSGSVSSVHDDDCYDSDDRYGDESNNGEEDDDANEEENADDTFQPRSSGGRGRRKRPPVMVVQERMTERTGWRYLSIRPALYEKHEEFNTPS